MRSGPPPSALRRARYDRFVTLRAIFFDLDDTLVDTYGTIPPRVSAALRVAEAFGARQRDRAEVEAVVAAVERGHPDRGWEHLLDAIGFTERAHAAQVIEAYEAGAPALSRATEGAVEILASVAARYRVVVVTNGERSLQQAKLEAAGLLRFVDEIAAADEAGARKPDAQIFGYACALAGCEPPEALHVGDSPRNDVYGALRAGIRAAWVRSAVHHAPVALPEGVPRLASLRDLLPLLPAAGGDATVALP